ncbi:MAG: hypothetical protein LBP27_04220 [Treponema sp.]|nr:hypothetical protein [Treponema sp.]
MRKLVKNGRTAGYRIRHAWILLALDGIPANDSWTDRTTAAACGSNIRSIGSGLSKRIPAYSVFFDS